MDGTPAGGVGSEVLVAVLGVSFGWLDDVACDGSAARGNDGDAIFTSCGAF